MTTATQYEHFDHRRALRAGFAAFVGTAIEFYDFYVYATAAALIFPKIFFPEISPGLATLASFATYGTGFLVRPLGGVLFGHIGDRIGRQRSLVLTLLLMGIATLLVGVLPTYASVGLLAPILLIVLRLAQGLAVGGEWGGAVLMAVENAPDRYKGFYGAFPQLGNPMGALLATGIFSLLSFIGTDFLHTWGWRIPFLLSVVLIGIGFWVRSTVEETPVFEKELARRHEEHIEHPELPLKTALRENWRTILIGIGLIPVSTGGYYIVTTFATAYGTGKPLNLDEGLILNVLTVAAFFELVSTLFIGLAADRWGRKRTMATGLVGTAILVIPMFLTMGHGEVWIMFALFSLVRVVMNATWAPLASIMSQMFDVDSRQTSLSISYSLGNALWAGFSPILATGLFIATGTIWSVIVLFVALTAISLVCLAFAPQRRDHVFEPVPSGGPIPDPAPAG